MKIISIYDTILMILKRERKKKPKKPTEFGKDVDLRISLNWIVIRENDVSGRQFEDRSSIRVWTSI